MLLFFFFLHNIHMSERGIADANYLPIVGYAKINSNLWNGNRINEILPRNIDPRYLIWKKKLFPP